MNPTRSPNEAKPQKAAVVGSGLWPTTAGVTKRITNPIPIMTVTIEKNSARPPFQMDEGREFPILCIDQV